MKMTKFSVLIFVLHMLALQACGKSSGNGEQIDDQQSKEEIMETNKEGMDIATFGAGCFWCVEAVFENLKGVEKVVSGYSGGHVENPTYKAVCSGTTGHAEVCQVHFDPSVISYKELLEIFWQTHDPTTLNRQGNDVGTQYRSAVFYHNDEQKELAQKYKERLDQSGAFRDPIVTEIVPFDKFYVAENYHQNYYEQNGSQPYCAFVIKPKVEKFKKAFSDKLKD
ncbi:MAG TPA: peptide-methionine (S)-S-oxide reductase [Cytophagales bacterium]|jgi:peptide-methionine (S)-S-oxide reductase|nr:peptide-methionine (S)-S-oxide reductase [Cytophagales bacterium]